MSAILPSTRPEQSRAALEQIIKAQKAKIKASDKVVVVAIRGYFRDSMGKPGVNEFGIYDDALFLVTPDKVLAFNGNTDPSNHNPGVAVLLPGVHRYRPGMHGLSGDHPYPAFRPNTPGEKVPVIRNGQTKQSTGVAINIHRGSRTTTSSLGCQTIHPDQWAEFKGAMDDALKAHNQADFPYVLTVKPDVAK